MSSGRHLGRGSEYPVIGDDNLLRLHSMRFCPYAQRVHLVLGAKNIPYHTININLKSKPEWFYQISPLGKVPALELTNEPGKPSLFESNVICEYLDEKYPQRRLFPIDPLKKAKDKILIERFNAFVIPIYKAIASEDPQDDIHIKIFTGLDTYEEDLEKRKTTFFGGDTPGMLDYMIWPWCERLAALTYQYGIIYELDEERFPKLCNWRDLMLMDTAVSKCYLDGEAHAKYQQSRRAGITNYDMLLEHRFNSFQ